MGSAAWRGSKFDGLVRVKRAMSSFPGIDDGRTITERPAACRAASIGMLC